jgi:hypothetical protein
MAKVGTLIGTLKEARDMSDDNEEYRAPQLHVAGKTTELLRGDFGTEDDSTFREPYETPAGGGGDGGGGDGGGGDGGGGDGGGGDGGGGDEGGGGGTPAGG